MDINLSRYQKREFDPAAMDAAAEKAIAELKELLNKETLDAVAQWWTRHYMDAGHKRLGRKLVSIAKGSEYEQEE